MVVPAENTPIRARAAVAASALVVAVAMAGVLPGCSRDGFEDRTATVTVDDTTASFTLDACGLDDDTLFVVGRSDDGSILQAVITLDDDGETGQPEGTGATFDLDAESFAAFGERAWELREGTGPAPGRISWAHLRGARIRAAGEAAPVDDDGRALAGSGADLVPFELDARCDERDDANLSV